MNYALYHFRYNARYHEIKHELFFRSDRFLPHRDRSEEKGRRIWRLRLCRCTGAKTGSVFAPHFHPTDGWDGSAVVISLLRRALETFFGQGMQESQSAKGKTNIIFNRQVDDMNHVLYHFRYNARYHEIKTNCFSVPTAFYRSRPLLSLLGGSPRWTARSAPCRRSAPVRRSSVRWRSAPSGRR